MDGRRDYPKPERSFVSEPENTLLEALVGRARATGFGGTDT